MSAHSNSDVDGARQAHRPVRALRFVLLLGIAAVGLAASGVASRREEASQLARWTAEQAVPTVAVTSPQSRKSSSLKPNRAMAGNWLVRRGKARTYLA